MDGIKLGVLGIDHNHILGMLSNMLANGCSCEHWWTKDTTATQDEFEKRFAQIERVDDQTRIIEDPSLDMILISAIPADRAALAIAAMRAGKDVMVDKPGCTTLEQLDELKQCVAATNRIWTVNFSERFEVPAVTKASQLVADGLIGTVKQTLGIGPHRHGLVPRPAWFYQREQFGGILTDIGSHQIDQFLHFTGSDNAVVSHALVENTTRPDQPEFQDYGEMVLRGNHGHGFIRVDWFTPDALPVWGDGRLFILGDKGYIELRKYIDIARSTFGNHLYYSNRDKVEHIDCTDVGLPYFPRLISDVRERTETAVSQRHTFLAMELALRAQRMAEDK